MTYRRRPHVHGHRPIYTFHSLDLASLPPHHTQKCSYTLFTLVMGLSPPSMSNVFASCPVPTHSRYCGTNCVGNWRGAPYQLSSRIAPNTSTVGELKLTRYQLCSSQSIRQIRRGPPSSCWVLTSDQACALSTMSSSSQLLLSYFLTIIAKLDRIIPKQGLLVEGWRFSKPAGPLKEVHQWTSPQNLFISLREGFK